MVNPVFQVQSQLYIHAAREAAWKKFTNLADWPRWNSEILATEWVTGTPWEEGSVFALRHKSLLGATTTTVATLRMVVAGQAATWESTGAGMQIINSARFDDDLGGCKLTARHSYHGAPAYLLRLLKARQQRTLAGAMEELKEYVEGPPRR